MKYLILLSFCFIKPILGDDRIINEMINPVAKIDVGPRMGSAITIYSKNNQTFLLTNHHCITNQIHNGGTKNETRDPVLIIFQSWTNSGRDREKINKLGHIAYYDIKKDLALIYVKDYSTKYTATLMDPKVVLTICDKVWNVGYPLNIDITMISEGIISGLNIPYSIAGANNSTIRTTAKMDYGSSGGGTYKKHNNNYYLIGIPHMVALRPKGISSWISYSISLETINKFLKENNCEFIQKKINAGPIKIWPSKIKNKVKINKGE